MFLKLLLKGMATYIPGLYDFVSVGTGGTISARYCYSVWLRHLSMAHDNGLPTDPEVIAELGPGDSLGVGLAALISGANRYYALDIISYALNKRNLEIFDELVELFKKCEDIPGEEEFPKVKPYLDSYDFPGHILTEERLANALGDERIRSIRSALERHEDSGRDDSPISYFVPWDDEKKIEFGSVDMLYSQAVLEHVDKLPYTYKVMHEWLKQTGFMSHVIDFKCHGFAKEWNGHWVYSDISWRLIKGARTYLLNRKPVSEHIRLLDETGFRIVSEIRLTDRSGICREKLAPMFKDISDDDLVTSGVFIQAAKDSGGMKL